MDPFVNRTAIVTGAASGIGRALSGRLARRGARVVAADIDAARTRRVEEELAGSAGGMARQGSGHIVNTASIAGLVPFPLSVAYSATKHAVVGLSTSLRAEGAGLYRVRADVEGLRAGIVLAQIAWP